MRFQIRHLYWILHLQCKKTFILDSPFAVQKDIYIGFSICSAGRLRKRDNLLTGEGEGAKFYHGEDAWFSINHAILSAIVQLEISRLSFPISVLSEVERR
jgi:hypothetical protein